MGKEERKSRRTDGIIREGKVGKVWRNDGWESRKNYKSENRRNEGEM